MSLVQAIEDAVISLLEEENPLLPEVLRLELEPAEYAALAKELRLNGKTVDPEKYPSVYVTLGGKKIHIFVRKEPTESVH